MRRRDLALNERKLGRLNNMSSQRGDFEAKRPLEHALWHSLLSMYVSYCTLHGNAVTVATRLSSCRLQHTETIAS